MERKDELKEIDVKNCTSYNFDHIMRVWDRDINFSDILLDEKLYKEKCENILIYNISCNTSMVAKPFSVRYNKMDLFKFIMELDI